MEEFLFDEFQPVTSKQWKQFIQVELNGLDFNKTLLSNTNEGITIKPFYHGDDFKKLDIPANKIGFLINQNVFVNDEKRANSLAKDALKRGANCITFTAIKPFDFNVLLQDIFSVSPNSIPVHFDFQFLEESFLKELIHFSAKENIYLHLDIIGNLVKNGNWFYSKKQDFEIVKSLGQLANKNISIVGIDASIYQNAGANTVQQVAYALAHANEYLNYFHSLLTEKKLEKNVFENLVHNMQFRFAIGGNYFFEIAKLRAFRYLFSLILKKYHVLADANIIAKPSLRNKTLYDYNMNMLRTTTECMSAVLGGANTIGNVSYDALFHKKNEFGERIARNQLLILKEESYINTGDFVSGTYYIEELTFEIATKALAIFQDIEKKGGFLIQLFEGTIQRKIEENAQKEQQQFDAGELVLTGTNIQVDAAEKMKKNIELYPFVKKKSHATILQPVIVKRLAEKLEQQRLELEK